MPYIKQERIFELWCPECEGKYPKTSGELNYLFTRIIMSYIGACYTYEHLNDVLGALEGCKMEFYRRIVVPYEEKKIKENGDVYQ